MEILVVILGILIFAMVVAIIIDIIEYRRYRHAARAVIALGASMQVSFDTVAEHLNRLSVQQIGLAQTVNSLEQQDVFISNLLRVHSEALGLNELSKAWILLEQFRKIGTGDDGEDSKGTVQGP